MPSGAMYMMVRVEQTGFCQSFDNDLDIVEALVTEQSVFCLPGKCFNIPNFFRIVLTVPQEMLIEACNRMMEFCKKYYDHRIAGKEIAYFMDDSSSFSCTDSSDDEERDQVDELTQKFNLNNFRNNVFSNHHSHKHRKRSTTRLA